jgi:MOSC domain-containing protein
VHVSSLARYPVKSCRGQAVDAAVVEPWGLAGDRRWMVVDPAGRFLRARTRPRMLLVVP